MIKEIYNAAAYIRLSREDGNKFEESNSVKNQRDLINEFVNNQDDISIYEYYVDDGKTGTNFDRPGFQKMIKDMYDKKIDCIIVKDLSRFGRNYIDVGRYIDYIFPTRNIRFISINDNIDSVKNPDSLDSVIVSFKNLMNDEYSRDISKKIRKVLEIKRLNGEITNGTAPYGYLIKGKDYIIDLEVRDIIIMIFEMCISGLSTTMIAYKLNEANIDCPKVYLAKKNHIIFAKKIYWDSASVGRILTNELYCGVLLQGKTTTLNNKVRISVSVPKEAWVRTENHHEPIIDRETFDKAQKCILSRKRNKSENGNVYNTIFRGYLKCYDCKKSMIKVSCNRYRDKIYIVYDCYTHRRISKDFCVSRRIKYNELINKVIEKINHDIDFFIEFESNKLDYIQDNKELSKVKDDILSKNNKINELEKFKREILYDLKKNLITKEDYDFYSETYNDETRRILKELNSIKEQEFTLSHDEEVIRCFIKKFKKYKNISTLTEKVLEDLIKKIYVKDDKSIEIVYLDNEIYEMIKEYNKKQYNGEM